MRNSQIWITYVGKNLAHRLPLIKCLSNKISAMEYRWLLKRAGASHFRFWNSLNAFLHAKMISCIFILPWTSSNKTNHKRVYNSHIFKYYLTEDIQGGPGVGLSGLGICFYHWLVSHSRPSWYHFLEQPLCEDLGSLLILETSSLYVVLENPLEIWKNSQASNLLSILHIAQAPLWSSPTLTSTLCLRTPP